MDCLAALFASHIKAGDCYCLFGAVGSGKSVFSRAFIRAVAEDDFLPVPSPTFLLQNTYDEHQGPPIHHFDFYRLTSLQDFNRLDIEGSLQRAVCLMEWPERLPSLPSECLAVHIEVLDHHAAQELARETGSCIGTDPPARLLNGHAFPVVSSYDSDTEPTCYGPGCGVEDVDTETEADDFTDRRPRLVTLTPHGSYWEGKARRIVSYIAAHTHACNGLSVISSSQGDSSQPQPAGSAGAPAGVASSSGSQ